MVTELRRVGSAAGQHAAGSASSAPLVSPTHFAVAAGPPGRRGADGKEAGLSLGVGGVEVFSEFVEPFGGSSCASGSHSFDPNRSQILVWSALFDGATGVTGSVVLQPVDACVRRFLPVK